MDSLHVVLDSVKVYSTSVQSPPQLIPWSIIIPAITALLGMLIGSAVSVYVANRNFRAQTVSKIRVETANTIRDTVAEIHSIGTSLNSWRLRGLFETGRDVDTNPQVKQLHYLCSRLRILLDDRVEEHLELVARTQKIQQQIEERNRPLTEQAFDSLLNSLVDLAKRVVRMEVEKANKGK